MGDIISNEYANNPAYFKPLIESLTLEAGSHFYHYLARRDISAFNPSTIPMTDLKRELRLGSVHPALMFMYRIALGEIELLGSIIDGILTATTNNLFNEFM